VSATIRIVLEASTVPKLASGMVHYSKYVSILLLHIVRSQNCLGKFVQLSNPRIHACNPLRIRMGGNGYRAICCINLCFHFPFKNEKPKDVLGFMNWDLKLFGDKR